MRTTLGRDPPQRGVCGGRPRRIMTTDPASLRQQANSVGQRAVDPMHHNANHAGSGPTATWGLRGSPPQYNDDRPGELATASEQGRPEVVGRVGLEPTAKGL